ncbi:HD domain-containing protein [Candidatus Fermentibacterales bacterium]|nr:HD domain-containing protein [Candidatus Fermentibacterales bacterium]
MTQNRKIMYVRDPVHGSIMLSELQEALLKTVEVQRLSFVHQLGMTFQCYPGAHGMRLLHAIGVSHLAARIGRTVLTAGAGALQPSIDGQRAIAMLEAAGMLHDIGHTPWSHTLEPLYREITGEGHMELVARLITGRARASIRGAGEIPSILLSHGLEPDDVADLITSRYEGPPACLQQMVFGEVDADMLDYLQRDFHFTGVAFGHIEVDRILSTMTLADDGRLVFLEKGLDAVRDFLHARLQMYSSVYLHRKTRIVDQMLLRAARRSILELGEIEGFQYMTDDQLLSFLLESSSDERVRDLAWRVKYRQKLFTQVFSVEAAAQSESERRFMGSLVSASDELGSVAPDLERRIADEAGLDPGDVMVDLPLEAVRSSEERFERLEVDFVDRKGRIRALSDLDPAFADYLSRAMPHRSMLTVSCSPEYRAAVAEACDKVFREGAIPLFEESG